MKRLDVPDNASGRQTQSEHLARSGKTEGNAMESLARDTSNIGVLGDTSMNFFGAAYGVQKADALLSTLQDRSNYSFDTQRDAMVLQYQIHNFDPVGRAPLVGFNQGTGGAFRTIAIVYGNG